MFEIGWSEMLLCAIVALLVVGPKDLPHMMRSFGRWVAQLRNLAAQFQRAMEDAAREMDNEDLREAKKGFSDLRSLRNPFDAAMRGVNESLRKAGETPRPSAGGEAAPPSAAPSAPPSAAPSAAAPSGAPAPVQAPPSEAASAIPASNAPDSADSPRR